MKTLDSVRLSTRRATRPVRVGLDALWAEFARTGSVAVRNELIVHYTPFVRHVVARLSGTLPRHFDEGDLTSYGIIGLIDALERFDPARDFRFETYALPRIRGAVIDELRSVDWVPRSVRSKRRAVEEAFEQLQSVLRRTPTHAELAGVLDWSIEELHKVQHGISKIGVLTLDDVTPGAGGEHPTLADSLPDSDRGPTELLEEKESRTDLAKAVQDLPDRERTVLQMYYYDELTLREIGVVLGVTESRACQIHTKALRRLHSELVQRTERPSRETVLARIGLRRAAERGSGEPRLQLAS